ncbi:IS66 family transposase [Mesorhizobium australicum]|uniref:IS66 family transposase n=1 Tax=Mesorhizobium australicum TaxID=536018 RepID=UPI003EBB3268
MPLFQLIERMCSRPSALRGDDTAIRGQVRDRAHRPIRATTGASAICYASSDRRGERPQKHVAGFAGILQCDCYVASSCCSTRSGKSSRSRRYLLRP